MDLLLSFQNSYNDTFLYTGFGVLIVLMMVIDLGLFNKKEHKVSNKEAVIWSAIWIGLALFFSVFVYMFKGENKASEFLTAYLIEKALSVDNLFVFILVFTFFKVPEKYHHRVLFWGVMGAIFLRAIFIFSGVWLIELTYFPEFTLMGYKIHLNAILFLFGIFLIYAGIKSVASDDEEENDFSESFGVKIIKKFLPIKEGYYRGRFFVRDDSGKLFGTMLLIVVAVIEMTDLLFAVDSIPAIFAVSDDAFILYSSNIFAILGLRTLYFLLANFMHLFAYLKYGLAFILSFIGAKMVIMPIYHVTSPVSLSVVAGILLLSIIASLIFKPEEDDEDEDDEEVVVSK